MKKILQLVFVVLLAFVYTNAYGGNSYSGLVLTTMNAGGYTYIEVDEAGGSKIWIAAPQSNVKVGDDISFAEEVWMNKFKSKTLNRTFDKILFVSNIKIGSGSSSNDHSGHSMSAPSQPYQSQHSQAYGGHEQQGAGGVPTSRTADAPAPNSIKKVENGYTVEELFTGNKDLNGKEVKVRGKVVKVSMNIMGRHWVHLKDGSGGEGSNDITFTSTGDVPEVGTIVVAKGVLEADKDFGGGYAYPAIVENSTFSK